jgi:type VI protein secretion system component VasK
MNTKRLNWPTWTGFLLSLFAFVSYFFIFVWFPNTRDFPWANLLLFICAVALLLIGLRRALAKERPLRSKIAAAIATALGVLVFALFIFNFFIAARWLPESRSAPRVGQKAPDFTLTDTTNKQVSLAELLAAPLNGKTPKGVLLIFYRGYW